LCISRNKYIRVRVRVRVRVDFVRPLCFYYYLSKHHHHYCCSGVKGGQLKGSHLSPTGTAHKGVKTGGTGSLGSISARAGSSLGFDLKGSLAAIGQWVDDMDSDDEDVSEGLRMINLTSKLTFMLTL
jgi:hypothetical protein